MDDLEDQLQKVRLNWQNEEHSAVIDTYSSMIKLLESQSSTSKICLSTIHRWRGLAHQAASDLNSAVEDYSKSIDLLKIQPGMEEEKGKSDGFSARVFRAMCLLQLHEDEQALEDLNFAIETESMDPMLWFYRATLKSRMAEEQDLEDLSQSALDDFNEAVRLDSQNSQVFLARAILKERRNDFQGALEDVGFALEIEADYVEAWVMRGRLLIKIGNTQEALKSLDRCSSNVCSLYWKAQAHVLDKKLEDALDAINAAIRENKEEVMGEILLTRGKIYMQMKMLQEAHEDFNRVLYDLGVNKSDVLFHRGIVQELLNKHQQAVKDYDAILSQDSEDFDVWFRRAYCNFHLGKFDQCIADLNRTIKLRPDDVDAWKLRAKVSIMMKKLPDALRDLDHLSRNLLPEDFPTKASLIITLTDHKQYYTALSEWRKTFSWKPGPQSSFLAVGIVLRYLCDTLRSSPRQFIPYVFGFVVALGGIWKVATH